MKRLRSLPCLLGLLIAGLASSASAQTVPFQTVAAGVGAFGHPAGHHVARTAQEFSDLGLDRFVGPSSPSIDWSSEMAVAVFMGGRSTGGYAIEVTHAELRQMMTILPVPGPPPSYELVVQVRETSPGPMDMVTMALTAPFHIVKLPQHTGPVSFEPAPARGQGFQQVSLHTQDPDHGGTHPLPGALTTTTDITIRASGDVTIMRTHPLIRFAPVYGTASAQDLQDLSAAVRNAEMGTVPNPLPVVIPFYLAHDPFTLTVDAPVSTLHGETTGQYGFYGSWDRQLRPLVDTVERIAQQILSPPSTQPFNRISRTVVQPIIGGRGTVEIDATGQVTFTRAALPPRIGMPAPLSGQATPAELTALEDAVANADLAGVPADLPMPVHIVAGDTFTLEVDSDDPRNHHTIRGEYGYYEQWDGRVRPIMDALDAIIGRLVDEANGANEAKGVVEVRGFWGFRQVFLVESPNMEYQVQPWSFARTLIKFEGHQVKVGGKVTSTGSNTAEIQADTLISPVRQDLEGRVRLDGDTAFIDQGWGAFPTPWPPIGPMPNPLLPPGPALASVETFGTAARVLTKAEGLRVSTDAYVFEDGYGQAYEAYIVGVRVTVQEDTDLTSWGNRVNEVRAGEEVIATRLSRSGNYVELQPNSGRKGYTRVTKVELGDRILWLAGEGPSTTSTSDEGALSGSSRGMIGSEALSGDDE